MSRKNLLQIDASPRESAVDQVGSLEARISRDIGKRELQSDIPTNPVSRALRGIEEKAARSNEYDEKVAAGLVIYELDHSLIDVSFIKDRIDLESSAIDELKAKIAVSGQSSPILVRPHPVDARRYQIVYGHRRFLATKALGIKVKAIIREIDDRELIIAQGQENNDHVGLSFIERSQFALGIRSLGYDMSVVMQAINANQSLAYKMLGIAEKIGMELIKAIGPAPSIGRRKWEELLDKLDDNRTKAISFLSGDEALLMDSDERFEKLFQFLAAERSTSIETDRSAQVSTAVEKGKSHLPKTWVSPDEDLLIQIKPNAKSFELSFKKPKSHKFGEWLTNRINQLYSEFEKEDKNDVK